MSSTHVFSRLRHNHLPAFRWRISLGGHPARPWFPLHVPCLFQACPSASCSWTLALPSVLPPTMFIYLHTLLWQPRVLSWRCGRPLRPSKSTPVLPSVWLWTAGICWRLLLGTVICWAKRVPREPPSSCVYVWGCVQRCAVVRLCMFACGMSSEKRRQVLAPVRVFVLERSGSRRAVKPPRCPGGADGMPSCSRDLTLGQHAAHLQEALGVSREEAVTDEVRPLLPDLRNCLPCRLWCLIDCTLHETRSVDDTVSCWDVQE